MAGGLRGFQQIAGWALIIIKEGFFGVKEIGKRYYSEEDKKDNEVENLFPLRGHVLILNHEVIKVNLIEYHGVQRKQGGWEARIRT